MTLNESKIELRKNIEVGYGDYEWKISNFHISEVDKEYEKSRPQQKFYHSTIYRNGKLEEVSGFEVTLERRSKYGNIISERLFNPILYIPIK